MLVTGYRAPEFRGASAGLCNRAGGAAMWPAGVCSDTRWRAV